MKKLLLITSIAIASLSGCSNNPSSELEAMDVTRAASTETADQETVTLPLQGEGDVNDSTK